MTAKKVPVSNTLLDMWFWNDVAYPSARRLAALATNCGAIMVENLSLAMSREWKGDETPLTVSDTAINQLVIDTLGPIYPNLNIIGEEKSCEVPNAEYTLLCDPVDGTIPFCMGIPVSAFCISVIKGNQPVAAVIYDPFQKRMWVAQDGGGCYLFNGNECSNFDSKTGGCPTLTGMMMCREWQSVSVSDHSTVKRSNVCMVWWKGSDYHLHGVCEKLMNAGAKWMNPCSIAYFGGIVASGQMEATIFPGKAGWETAAMQLIVEEAGGKVTDIFGNEMQYGPKGEIQGHIISNGLFHDVLVKMVRESQPVG